MMTHEQSNFRRASVGLLQKGVHQILKDNYYREAGEVQGLSRVTRRSHGERILAPRNNAIGQVERIPSLPSYG